MSHINRVYLSLVLFFLSFSLILAIGTQQNNLGNYLGEIYKSGEIEFKPLLEISHDSIPSRILSKNFSGLVQGNGFIYVSDSGVGDIKIFKSDGKFFKKFGIKGRGPGDLYAPHLMCISKNRLVVWEIGNKRFSYFSAKGKYIKIKKPTLKGRLVQMKALDDGRIVLEILRVANNKSQAKISDLRVIELYSSEMSFIKEVYTQKERLHKYFKTPRPHYRMILPYRPKLHWDLLPGGKIVLAFSRKYQLKIMNLDSGKMSAISRDYSPVKIAEVDKQRYLDSCFHRENGSFKRGASKFVRDNIEFPEFKPAFKNIHTDREGHILVFPFSLSDVGKSTYKANSFEVFDENGNLINRVKIKNGSDYDFIKFTQVGVNAFWCIKEGQVESTFIKYEVH